MATDTLAISSSGLTKRFGSVAAVDAIDLAVPTGSVFGFLGPNGSGKTTTIRMLLGLINPTSGSWELLGRAMPQAASEALTRVGSLIEGPAFYPWLSGRDNLARLDAAGPDPRRDTRNGRIGDALARVGLSAAAEKKYRAYSLGMRQRLGLAAALLRTRDLLVLDEPTNGMDPQGTREIRHLVRELAGDGTTIFVSSHLLSEIEQMCTHAAVMSRGRLLAQGTLAELRAAGAARLVVEVDQVAQARKVLEGLGIADLADTASPGQAATNGGEEGFRVVSGRLGATTPEDCCRELVMAGVAVRGLAVERPSLEDLFVSLTGEGFDVAN
ncbi:MAG: ABC transporter ATP-binding protein [Acidimicrobiaceae bacterium]|nr:ABC transporter ATP-binding protein [Acidimicrobiaceae bacterium]